MMSRAHRARGVSEKARAGPEYSAPSRSPKIEIRLVQQVVAPSVRPGPLAPQLPAGDVVELPIKRCEQLLPSVGIAGVRRGDQ